MNPMQSKKSVPFSVKEKAVGRGVAKAQQQASSKKVPMSGLNSGGGSKPYGGGIIRGTNGASSGKKWVGVR